MDVQKKEIDVQKTKVILVGNSMFPSWGEGKDIPNVEQNMELLKKIFTDPKYFGIPDDANHLVEIKNGSSQEILLTVKHETKSFLEKDLFDRLIFYYSGHGIPGEDSILFFASKDTIRNDYEITSVNSHRLFSYLEAFCAKELIVILDCCYAAQSKENQGDEDSLISKSLPEDKAELEASENGIYYLFAAGKDNVAKFNPKEPKKPTYFTEALLSSIGKGTEPGRPFITIGELYIQLRKEIAELKKIASADIPDPRAVLQGNVNGFIFCRNINVQNQEDNDWLDLHDDPGMKKLLLFKEKYPETRFEKEMDDLTSRMIKGEKALKTMDENKDIEMAIEIKRVYKDIRYIKKRADNFINAQLAVNAKQDDKKMESATFNDKSLIKDFPNASLMQSPDSAFEKETETKPIDPGSFSTKSSNTART
jgi:hypothetical protein